MKLYKSTLNKLKKFSKVFKEARDRDANESDTVMYLIKFFEEVFGFNSLAGEISKEVSIKDRYCDFAIKQGEEIKYLVEAKAASHKVLHDRDIEQAENYAANSGIHWILLTNGIEWKLYHLTFNGDEGIAHNEIFSIHFIDEIESDPEKVWEALNLLSKESLKRGDINNYSDQQKALSVESIIPTLLSEPVLMSIRREIRKNTKIQLDIKDIFESLKKKWSEKTTEELVGKTEFKKKRTRHTKDKTEDINKNSNPQKLVEMKNSEKNDDKMKGMSGKPGTELKQSNLSSQDPKIVD